MLCCYSIWISRVVLEKLTFYIGGPCNVGLMLRVMNRDTLQSTAVNVPYIESYEPRLSAVYGCQCSLYWELWTETFCSIRLSMFLLLGVMNRDFLQYTAVNVPYVESYEPRFSAVYGCQCSLYWELWTETFCSTRLSMFLILRVNNRDSLQSTAVNVPLKQKFFWNLTNFQD